ncbi:type VII secretion protein EssC [Lysinibacillus halotolerans]
MIVTLLSKKSISSTILPEKVTGQYWIYDNANTKELISIEASSKQEWILKSNKNYSILDSKGSRIKNTILSPLSIYNLSVKEDTDKTFIFTEPNTLDRQEFTKLLVDRDMEITFGRSEQNDLVLDNRFVSGAHFKLSLHKDQWRIKDLNSTNGTYVNGERVTEKDLNFGDLIYVMGFKIIVGSCFIACNNPDGSLHIKSPLLQRFEPQEIEEINEEDEEVENIEPDYFYRSPRFKRDIEKPVFKVDSPPPNAIGEEMPIMLVIGPSVTMGMASMATALFAINNAMANGNIAAATPAIIMSCSMLIGTILWPILSKKYDAKRRRKKEKKRQEKYKKYLDHFATIFKDECDRQSAILHENIVTVDDCIGRIENRGRNLWERDFGQDDFLKLRVGLGQEELNAEIKFAEKKFSIEDDNLQEELYTLCEEPKILENVPKTISLYEDRFAGVIGERERSIEFAKGLIFQLASLYSYDELKMVFVYEKDEEEIFKFTKWLPHVWNNERSFRFIACDKNEMKELSAYLEKEIEYRKQANDSEIEEVKPYYVIFSMSKELAKRGEMFKQLFEEKRQIMMSVVTFYDELKHLPKECTKVVELKNNKGYLFDKNDISGKVVEFEPDIDVKADVEKLSIQLANIPLDISDGRFNLPKVITFLELFGVGKVEHLNSLTRWKENDPTKSLQAEIGVDTLGETFMLDLHEKFHGPHGLVAGMTGSGKSEFIISYILSLAVNYHPNEVAFILIDYKGGGMAKSFENLPHTAGIITNLDGAAIKRSLVSIESELKRRQAIFAQASKQVGESNIDIYKYQRLYREGVVNEPLQHLFIISDEFAELKTQQPEFMAQLVSAARIGRSLGVHLILATQKPSGVVDDQIWSNSRFRVSLKVQDKADSMDMLKRPEAAELKDTGRFYLQVGYNELFELGQSAWAGAPYYPSDKIVVEKDNSIVVIDRNGRPLREGKYDKKKALNSNPKKQLDVITQYLNKIADEENIKIRQLWLEPIPSMILLDALMEKYPQPKTSIALNPLIGEYDDPENQKQDVLRLPLTQEGNVVVYGAAGSGKTTFINTMVTSLMKEHTPDEVNIYLLDFASETLRAFESAPHVGDVIYAHEGEKVSNLFRMLKLEVSNRKKMFADYGGDQASYIRLTGNKVPSIVVAINNFSAFTELFEEKEEAVAYLSREGMKYGIYFVLTALSANSVRFRLLQNFKQQIALQLNDENDYTMIVGKTGGLVPSKHKGRGLIKLDKVYEFQVAHITEENIPYPFIVNMCTEAQKAWGKPGAKRIPILPKNVDIEFLSNYISAENTLNLPVGVEKSSLNVTHYPFNKFYINLVLSNGEGSNIFGKELAQFIGQKTTLPIEVIDFKRELEVMDSPHIIRYESLEACKQAINELFSLVLYRNNTYKDALESGTEIEPFEQRVYMIQSVTALKSQLTGEDAKKLELILEKGNVKYNITIILVEQSKNLSSITFEQWFKQNVSLTDAIWVGSGITDQFKLEIKNVNAEMRADIDMTDEFGYVVRNGKATKVKLLNPIKEEEFDEQSVS